MGVQKVEVKSVGTQQANGENDGHWKVIEIATALTHYCYLTGQKDLNEIPVTAVAKMLGCHRTTIWRAIKIIQGTSDLALELQKRVAQYEKMPRQAGSEKPPMGRRKGTTGRPYPPNRKSRKVEPQVAHEQYHHEHHHPV